MCRQCRGSVKFQCDSEGADLAAVGWRWAPGSASHLQPCGGGQGAVPHSRGRGREEALRLYWPKCKLFSSFLTQILKKYTQVTSNYEFIFISLSSNYPVYLSFIKGMSANLLTIMWGQCCAVIYIKSMCDLLDCSLATISFNWKYS